MIRGMNWYDSVLWDIRIKLSSCYMVQNGAKTFKNFQKLSISVVLMWCICGKPKTLKPEKRVVLLAELWWCCGEHVVGSRIKMDLGRIRMELG